MVRSDTKRPLTALLALRGPDPCHDGRGPFGGRAGDAIGGSGAASFPSPSNSARISWCTIGEPWSHWKLPPRDGGVGGTADRCDAADDCSRLAPPDADRLGGGLGFRAPLMRLARRSASAAVLGSLKPHSRATRCTLGGDTPLSRGFGGAAAAAEGSASRSTAPPTPEALSIQPPTSGAGGCVASGWPKSSPACALSAVWSKSAMRSTATAPKGSSSSAPSSRSNWARSTSSYSKSSPS
mmetsp:Transcript_28938/g.86869  ORF Transcript_28938/g.86869 Transcript_28938/m.86869 type:complete len:239 (-) Transcript_28938:166-882(-)